MFLTKDAVMLGLPGHAEGVACDGCPPIERLFEQFTTGGGGTASLPDLLQRPQARRVGDRPERPPWRRNAALGVDRRRRDGLQLLRGGESGD
jgi:hypothetical protein